MVRGHISFSLIQSSLLLVSEISAGISSDNINRWIINTKFNTWVITKYCNGPVCQRSWLALVNTGTCKCPKISIQGTPATVTNFYPRDTSYSHKFTEIISFSSSSFLLWHGCTVPLVSPSFPGLCKEQGPYAYSPFSSATCCPPFSPQVITTPSESYTFLPHFLVSLISSLLI